MSDLTAALNRILHWLQRQRREHPQATQDWWIRSVEENYSYPFLNILEEEYWLTRYWATVALGYIGDDRALPALNEMLQDNFEMVREAAQKAISQIVKRNH